MEPYKRRDQGQGGRKHNRPFEGRPRAPPNPPKMSGSVGLVTNNFKMRSVSNSVIYNYAVEIAEVGVAAPTEPEDEQLGQKKQMGLETYLKHKIMSQQADSLRQIFVHYIFVGTNLFSTTMIEDLISLPRKSTLGNRQFTVNLEKVSYFSLNDLQTMRMEDHPVALSFLNMVIKQAMRSQKLKQIGRVPRFFDDTKAQRVDNVDIWPGFFTSSWIFQNGTYLTIDNISKFLSVDNCLEQIKERLRRYDQYHVSREFDGSVIMARYGPHRTYKVSCIKWDLNPQKYCFEQSDGGEITMLEYFKQNYNLKIKDPEQPLFEVKQKKHSIFFPPELCTLVGIPAKVRESKRQMAFLRQSLFQRPHERIHSIKHINRLISESQELRDWGIQITHEPEEIEAKILTRPAIQTNGGKPKTLEDTQILSKIIHQPMSFTTWAIFCIKKDVENAKYIQDKFYDLSEQQGMGVYVDYGHIIALDDRSRVDDFKQAIDSFYYDKIAPQHSGGKGQRKQPQQDRSKDYFFLVVMPDHIRQEQFYTTIKSKINADTPVISQFVAAKTIMKDNDRIFVNILRQINAKLGGDLWRMDFHKDISKKTMLVGIDVCHKGKQSIIGFCASYDTHMCKYFTQTCPQEVKGKEIISQQVLLDYFIDAFEAYKDYNDGDMPDHVFIYRDGVGDSMRSQVIHHELDQLKQIIQEVYGENQHPHITLIFVNKRVRQRFFEKQGQAKIFNPPQGTYVDRGFVEQSEVIDGKFDFFLTPHSVTQGSVKPTHFYVAENTSNLSKEAILNFTYSLCYNYYNWPDSIKIPAPCMLADKIAIYRNEIGNIPQSGHIHRLQFYL